MEIFTVKRQRDLEADAIIHTFVYVCISAEHSINLANLSNLA